MNGEDNTLLMRLAGPLQSWGTCSRFQLRRTDPYPSKAGVLGLLFCAIGITRQASQPQLERIVPLVMGVRVDRPGTFDWDYHTAGAKHGMRSADGRIKKTPSTDKLETLLSRRQYLMDASFLVALQGASDAVAACACALEAPVWPVYLGRKCCVPAEPVLVNTGTFDTLADALSSVPWQPRVNAVDRKDGRRTRTLDTFIEHSAGSPEPKGARLVHDVPRRFGYHDYGPRWVVAGNVTVPVAAAMQKYEMLPASEPENPEWERIRLVRLAVDNYLCVFCKSPAVDVHHLDYCDVRPETLRSLCKTCHDACTMLEYGGDMRRQRIDPSDSEQRALILDQIERLYRERRYDRRRELLASSRSVHIDFFEQAPS